MNKTRFHLISLAIIGTLLSWMAIHLWIIEISFWKYLLVETIIISMKILYEQEKKRVGR
jgi:Ca2+-dependent lipid-binding protein